MAIRQARQAVIPALVLSAMMAGALAAQETAPQVDTLVAPVLGEPDGSSEGAITLPGADAAPEGAAAPALDGAGETTGAEAPAETSGQAEDPVAEGAEAPATLAEGVEAPANLTEGVDPLLSEGVEPAAELTAEPLPEAAPEPRSGLAGAYDRAMEFLINGGPAIWAIAALSVVTVALILWKIWRLVLAGAWSRRMSRRAVGAWENGEAALALSMIERRKGLRSRLTRAAMQARLTMPDDAAREETSRVARGLLASQGDRAQGAGADLDHRA
uniref:hypothetical protein n=1 Tax=Oceanicola sp. S124 TaxID=1042378 RepID=UPI00110F825F